VPIEMFYSSNFREKRQPRSKYEAQSDIAVAPQLVV